MFTFARKLVCAAGVCIAPLAYGEALNLTQILQRAGGETPDRVVIEQTYLASVAEANTFRSEIFPKLNLTLSGNRVGQALSGLQLGSNPGSGDETGMPGTAATPASDPPSHIYGNQYGWQLGFKTPLLGFGRLGTVYQLSKMQAQFADQGRDLQLQIYYFSIIQAYNSALLNLNTFEAAKKAESYAEALLKFNQIEAQTGGASQIDLLRSQSNHALAQAETSRTENEAEAALLRLKILLNIPEGARFELQSGTDVAGSFLQVRGGETKRLEIAIAEQQTAMAEKLATYRSRQFWPTLYMTAGADSSILAFGGSFNRDGASEPGDAFKEDNISYSIGLSLEWLLFDGFARSEGAKKAAADAMIAKTELAKLKRNDGVIKSEAKRSVEVAKLVFDASASANQASQLAFDKISSDFKAGTASLTDVLETQKNLYETEKRLNEALAARILAAANYRLTHGVDLMEGK